MDWKRIFNPWAVIRSLETSMAVMEDRCEEYRERAYEAEDRAFSRASEHYYQRSRQVELQNAHLLDQLTSLDSLRPRSFTVSPSDFAALTTGLATDQQQR